jgi:hypothetical protein
MRRLRIGGLVVALLALLGMASGCGAAPVSSAVTAARADAKHEAAARPTGITASQVIWDKEHGIIPPVQGGPKYVKHADLFTGVSCAGSQCVAVGFYYYGVSPKNPERTLAELWTGTAWRLQQSPVGSLAAVSCAAPGSCLAVGAPVIADSGGRWRVVAKTSDMVAVSCASADACVAVGWADATRLLYATWNGRTWRTGTMHAPPRPAEEAAISGVSCTSADDCIAVGHYAYGLTAMPSPSNRDRTLAERWNGRTWHVLPTMNVSNSNALTAVSCAGPEDCTAIGENTSAPLAEHWNGKSWRVEPVPTVSSIGNLQLTGLSCPAANFCVATGTYQVEPIAETWDGRKWRLTVLPMPPTENDVIDVSGVSCASTRECVIVGDDAFGTFAELYKSGKWQVTATRNPL